MVYVSELMKSIVHALFDQIELNKYATLFIKPKQCSYELRGLNYES